MSEQRTTPKGKIDIIRDQWVCVDCLFALANGEYPDDATRAAEIEAGETRELPYRWALDGPHEGESEEADQDPFSWRPCACCGSRLGGSRHRAALILALVEYNRSVKS